MGNCNISIMQSYRDEMKTVLIEMGEVGRLRCEAIHMLILRVKCDLSQ